MKKVFFMLIALVAMTACSSVDEPAKMAVTDNASVSAKFLTEDEAVKVAQSALVDFGFSKPSRSNGKANVSVYRSHASRGAESDTAFFIVNFTNGGFAVVAADKTIDKPVFGVGPGQFEVSPDNGTSDYMEAAALYACRPGFGDGIGPTKPKGPVTIQPADSIDPGVFIGDFDGWGYYQRYVGTDTVKCEKFVATAWGQEDPYNEFCDGYKVGCGPLAMGQIFTYYRKPTSIGIYNLDWNMILETTKLFAWSSQTRIDMVGHMLREIGLDSNANYTNNGTGVYWPGVLSSLNKYGYSSAYVSDDISAGRNQILQHGPTLIASPGHMWVTDGYITHIDKYELRAKDKSLIGNNYERTHYLHMNWGWDGTSNGYFRMDGEIKVKMSDTYEVYGIYREFQYAVNVY